MNNKPTITIVGAGNVAWHLCNVFLANNYDIIAVANRTVDNLIDIKNSFGLPCVGLDSLPESDVTILAISDKAISTVSKKIKSKCIVHTSGSANISEINGRCKGVLYPFQSFTSFKKIEYEKISVFIEYSDSYAEFSLKYLSAAISSNVHSLDSSKRMVLHLSGVLTNNFVNVLLEQAVILLETHEIPSDVIWPLLAETIDKARTIGPTHAQTGPAVRNDTTTLSKHFNLLKRQPNLQEAYSILSKLIQEKQTS